MRKTMPKAMGQGARYVEPDAADCSLLYSGLDRCAVLVAHVVGCGVELPLYSSRQLSPIPECILGDWTDGVVAEENEDGPGCTAPTVLWYGQ